MSTSVFYLGILRIKIEVVEGHSSSHFSAQSHNSSISSSSSESIGILKSYTLVMIKVTGIINDVLLLFLHIIIYIEDGIFTYLGFKLVNESLDLIIVIVNLEIVSFPNLLNVRSGRRISYKCD